LAESRLPAKYSNKFKTIFIQFGHASSKIAQLRGLLYDTNNPMRLIDREHIKLSFMSAGFIQS